MGSINSVSYSFIDKCRNLLSLEDLIDTSERRLHYQIRSAASEIIFGEYSLIRLAGPSGSGKTTVAKKIMREIKDRGLPAYYMSMDNWYKTLSVDNMPRTEDGDLDFESPELLDVDAFLEDMHNLISGKPIHLREFDFKERVSHISERTLQCVPGAYIIIEGIHALNPMFDSDIKSMKIYVEPSDIKFDNGDVITSSDIRLCRRIHRDMVERGMSVEATVEKCRSVDLGQNKYIAPFINGTDIFKIDTLIHYEIFIHKNELGDRYNLDDIPFTDIKRTKIPNTSLLKEFYIE